MNGLVRINEGMRCSLKGPVFKIINFLSFLVLFAGSLSDGVSYIHTVIYRIHEVANRS
jgi:hypothetical protein